MDFAEKIYARCLAYVQMRIRRFYPTVPVVRKKLFL